MTSSPPGLTAAIIDDDTPTPVHARYSRTRLVALVATFLVLWAGTFVTGIFFLPT